MSMLQTIMSSVMNNAMRPRSTAATGEDPLEKENRAALRKLFENAGPKERKALFPSLEKAGIDTDPYKAMEGIETSQEQSNRLLEQEFLRILGGGQPASPATTQTPSMPATSITPAETTTEQPQVKPEIFSRDFLTRAAIKKYSGIDVGAHYFDAPDWFSHYGELVKSGTPIEQAVSDTAIKFGFIPDGASNLEGLSDVDRNVIFQRELSSALSDEDLDAVIRNIIPKGTDGQKAKLGLVLDAFASQGRYIAPEYQKYLDRFRGLEDPDFVSNDKLTWIYQNRGKMPSEVTPQDIADADKSLRDQAIVDAVKRTYGETEARMDVEFAEDRAKYGIPAQFKTAAELADAGYRFPSNAEMELYNNFYSIRETMQDLQEALFGSEADPSTGVFTGIGTNIGERTTAKGRLAYERAKGTPQGQNYEYYQDVLASIARTLLKMANSGSSERPTDVDIRQIMQSAPDTGTGLVGLPDSEIVARRKFERYLLLVGKQLERIQQTTTLGLKEQSAPVPEEDEYKVGDVYEFDDGTIREYTGGEEQWKVIPQNQ